jgi:hypothetical protein
MIAVSENASPSPTGAVNAKNSTSADMHDPITVARGSGRPTVQSTGEALQSTEVTTPRSPSPRAGDLPIEAGTSMEAVAENQTEMSRTLESADEAMDTLKTWKSAIGVIKRVMDNVGPIVKVCFTSLLSILRYANFHSSVTPPWKPSMGTTLKDSRGASPCLVSECGTFTPFIDPPDFPSTVSARRQRPIAT